MLLNIRKQSGTNTVEVARLLKERLAELQKNSPADRRITLVRDQSVFIQASVDTVKEHLTLGAVLAAVVIFFFLANFRTTVISALAIPTSIISAFAVIYYMGFTLNSLTLLALALSVGIVIDDAIVVLENIYRYIEEKGCTPFEAAAAATKEIGLAVLSITLSLIAVFLPIAFMGGIVGRFLKSFGVTMAATILVSMIISFSLTPMLAARWLKLKRAAHRPTAARAAGRQRRRGAEGDSPISPGDASRLRGENRDSPAASRGGFYHWIESGYMAMLALLAPPPLGGGPGCVAWHGGRLMPTSRCCRTSAQNFLPDDDQSEFEVKVRAPEGTSLEATFVILDRISRDVRRLQRRRVHAHLRGRQRPADRQRGHGLRPHGAASRGGGSTSSR